MGRRYVSIAVILNVGLVVALPIFLNLGGHPRIARAAAAITINEIRIDQPNTDNDEYFELAGDAGASLDGLTYLVVGDGTGGSGVVEAVVNLAGHSLPGDGYFLAAESTYSLGTADLTTSLNFENGDNVTHLLVSDFSGAVADDLDTNDDGVLDATPWTEILDLIAIIEEVNPPTNTEYHYGPPTVGPNGLFVPSHVVRCPEGWVIGASDPVGGDDTPGAANPCQGGAGDLVINEIDYDQPSTDAAEFVEIRNKSAWAVNLDLYSLVLVNGTGGGAQVYVTVDLPDVLLPSRDYYVVCGDAATVPQCDLDVSPDTNLIQNGAPDAVALFFEDQLIDTVSYEGDTGAPYTEGSGGGLLDDSSQGDMGISRCPDGTDTDQNNADFGFVSITPGAANACEQCGGAATPIHDIQGSGLSTPIPGATDVAIEGVVVGDFQDTVTGLSGFFVQEEDGDGDADPLTSEGIFVYDAGFGVDVALGDVVRARGDVTEYNDLTELNNVSAMVICSSGLTVTETILDLPVAAVDDLERYEGMLVTFAETLFATEHYNLGRYGEVSLSVDGRLPVPTNVTSPGSPALALQDLNDRSRLLLDDGSNVQNPPTVPYLAADNTLRLGDTVEDLTGVLSYGFGEYRLQPTVQPTFVRANDRPTAPVDDGDTFTIAGFNLLNYFNGDGLGGGFPTERGASTLSEFSRQRTKLIAAIVAMEADVIGVVEMENDGYTATSAIQDLVNGLNDITGAGTYAFINPGVPQIGTDAITVGFLYNTTTATPAGAAAILDSSVDPTFLDDKNRPSLAQTFDVNATGERLTIAVNHLKSKGSNCDDVGDPDTGDGQGNCNLTRTKAATALVNWLVTDPTGSGDPDFLIIGDMNAYAMEDPITAMKNAGYTDLIGVFLGAGAYSYVFDGQAGYIDHALANARLRPHVTSTTVWHINADEPTVLDYNQEYNPPPLYSPDAYRAADHDPVLVHLKEPSRVFLPAVMRNYVGPLP